MCGIVGIHGPQDDAWVDAMNARIVHRGPDGDGVYRDRDAGLAMAMRRLAIVDIDGGRQPMTTSDGRHTIVFNGEIFNAPELRRDLEAAGVAFRTDHSDTEVILNGYARHGAAFVERLNGMFAFAIHDREANTLFCARDHAGIKPFHYVDDGRRFAFASELKSLLALPFVARQVDRESLFAYMSLMFVPGERTIIDGVRRLAPGHTLTLDLGTRAVQVRRWWRMPLAPATARPQADWPSLVRDGLARASRRWTLSDVPYGCLLSGGLDSSAIVALLAQQGDSPRTYSLGFTGPGEEQWSELPLARAVAKAWGTEHHEIVLDPRTLVDELPAMAWHMDEPYGGGLPSWSVFKFLGQHVKVALTGTGGDELFGNYQRFVGLEGGFVGRALGRTGAASLARFRTGYFDRQYYCSDADKRRHVLTPGSDAPADTAALLYAHYRHDARATARDRTTRVDFETQLPEEFLAMTDRFSMAHHVEARTPFLDREFIDLVLTIPASVRLHHRHYKRFLRDVLRGVLPDEILAAPKRGFVIPLKLWLRDALRPLVEHLLDPNRLARQGYFQPGFYRWAVLPHLEGRADNTTLVWGALMFQIWHSVYIEADCATTPSWTADALVA